ncbi:MAG: cation transporter [Deltaproteobacteria bacterium]|nr:cation transporter [Deltaproteobacteria bacterium]
MRSKALYLAYFTIGYNILEGLASVIAGYAAGSPALVGFGLDSAIESLSGGVVVWRFLKHGRIPPEEEERVEKKAVKLIGTSFFVLGAYVLFESAGKLLFIEPPRPSPFGIIIALLSLIIMPILAYSKYSTGRMMKSRSLVADSKQTFVCSLLSAALVTGLGLNYIYGLWWADPVSALVIVAFIVREGVRAFREEKLCAC